jgi:hypothetical protein
LTLLRFIAMQSSENSAISSRCIALALLLATSDLVLAGQPSCTPTQITQSEAEQLVLSIPAALTAKRAGEELFVYANEPESLGDSYSFMLRTGVRPQAASMGNGLIGYYDVSKKTGRVLNVAMRMEKGNELEALQSKLRSKHCVSPQMIKAEHDADDYEHDE